MLSRRNGACFVSSPSWGERAAVRRRMNGPRPTHVSFSARRQQHQQVMSTAADELFRVCVELFVVASWEARTCVEDSSISGKMLLG